MTQQGFAESDSSSNMYTTGGLSTGVTVSPPQAQQGFAEPSLDTYVQLTGSVYTNWVWLTLTQPQDSVKKGGWVWFLTHGSETQWRSWLILALDTRLRDSPKKVAESGSWHMAQGLNEEGGWVWLLTQDATRTPETQFRTGLSLASQRDIYREGKQVKKC